MERTMSTDCLFAQKRLHQKAGRRFLNPLKYGDFLFPGKRTYSKKKQCKPDIEELKDVMENEDHSIPLEELVERLHTNIETGLTENQVNPLREIYGENLISVPDTTSKCIELKQKIRGTYYLLSIGVLVCFVTAAVPSLQPSGTFALDNMYIGFVMVALLATFSFISYKQEMKSLTIMSSFKDLYPQYASVLRDGVKVRIHKKDLVVGDLVLIKEGICIPADLRITRAWDLKVEETPLIFKENISKTPECTNKNPAVSQNVAFCGTWCTQGYGQGIVTATGNCTAYGQMLKQAAVFQNMNTTTHNVIKKFIRSFGVGTAVVCLILLCLNFVRVYSWITLSILLLSLVIASMPDVLNPTVTASLYLAAKKMVSINCLPKDYEAVEKVGSVSVICCTKTGTITQNRMTVVRAWVDGMLSDVLPSNDRGAMHLDSTPSGETWDAFARAACLCNSIATKSRRNRCIIRKGCSCDQSEVAIMEFMHNIHKNGSNLAESYYCGHKFRKAFDVPSDTFKNYNMTVHDVGHLEPGGQSCTFLVCIKGAVEVILDFCSTVLIQGKEVPISSLEDLRFKKIFKHVMKNGEKILGFCDYLIPEDQFPHDHIFQNSDIPLKGFRFLGFVSLLDPPRASVPDAISKCKKAGIKIILMTSDHPITGKAVAKQVGIISSHLETRDEIAKRLRISEEQVPLGSTKSIIVKGSQLEAMNKEDLQQILRNFDEIVFARINSSQKLDVVECLQKDQHVVAVTGDTMDDVLAMDKADIGIGMGMHGYDICRNTADVILMGDSFASFVSSIEAGRLIFENLRKAVVYVLSSNLPELLSIVTAFVLHIPFTLGAVFVLLITLIAETIPVLLLVHEKAERNILMRDKLGPLTFFEGRFIQKAYCQVGVICFLGGLFMYFAVMAENGFMPSRILGIAKAWNSAAVNDLTDSYNQEWTYTSRKSLEYTCQSVFFLTVITIQWFHIGSLKSRIHCNKFLLINVIVPTVQVLFILFLMYTPVVSTVFHFFPLRFSDWFLSLPFAIFYIIYEEVRRFIIRHSEKNFWLEKET